MSIADTFWLDRSVFITGATGLVRNCVVKQLLEKGATITCLVRDWVPLFNEGVVNERVTYWPSAYIQRMY